MIVIYTEIEMIDQFFLFDDELPHWNTILKSGINICLNASDDELDARLQDPEDPLFIALTGSETMLVPTALEKDIRKIKENLSLASEYPRSIFLLDIDNEDAMKAREDFGIAIYTMNDYPENIFSFSYYVDLEKGQKVGNGWKGIVKFDKPLSNSLIITDNHYFKNDDNGTNRGFVNLVDFIDAFLPNELSIDYHITIFAEDCNKTNEWWNKEFGKLVALIKPLRKFNIETELVLTTTIHRRRFISNYVIGKSDQGFDIFHAKNKEEIKNDNDFEHSEIFSNLTNEGTKQFQAVDGTLSKLEKILKDVSEYVSNSGNSPGRMMLGCNKNKTIKNRLLN